MARLIAALLLATAAALKDTAALEAYLRPTLDIMGKLKSRQGWNLLKLGAATPPGSRSALLPRPRLHLPSPRGRVAVRRRRPNLQGPSAPIDGVSLARETHAGKAP